MSNYTSDGFTYIIPQRVIGRGSSCLTSGTIAGPIHPTTTTTITTMAGLMPPIQIPTYFMCHPQVLINSISLVVVVAVVVGG